MSRNVPKLRFKGFEDEWKEKSFKDIFNGFEYGMNSAAVEFDGKNRYIRITDIDDRNSKYKSKNPVSPEGILEDKYLVKSNDILFARTGASVGKTYLYDKEDGKLYFAGFLIRGNVNCENNAKFIFTQTKTLNYEKWVKVMSMRSGQPGINSQEYSSYKIKVPSLQEQEKIANFLSKVDSIIEKQEKKVEYWNSYKKGMMQKIFSQKIRFKDENGRDYPEWEEEKLGGIGQTYTGLSGKTKDDFGFGNGKYITYVNIFKNTKVDINMFDLVDIKKDEKQNKVLKGDILFTASSETPNEVGMASVCDNNIENLYLNSFCFGFRLNSKKDIDYIFIGYLLRSPSLRKKISILAQGSTRYNLSKSEFMKIKIQIPCLEEQRKIVNFLSNIDNLIEKESKKLEELKQWKKGLLQQMFV
ncbi:restriction endonuclease subunit S [Clostridium perfringens]|uniref:restriction endonuclease subunit S n=1 Tax=Clostridium perfringens TaxID=1502 RepID=UPI002AC37338|nr:restriction endonuclease subunit S [Clostridium perfringens]MDZ5006507.1 restriction endonuclease subunit S [Clostridium perfringens]